MRISKNKETERIHELELSNHKLHNFNIKIKALVVPRVTEGVVVMELVEEFVKT